MFGQRSSGCGDSPLAIAALIRRGTEDASFGHGGGPAHLSSYSSAMLLALNGRAPVSPCHNATQKLYWSV